MRQENNDRSGQLVLILLVTAAACLALYLLPDELFGFRIKKMDMLSDLRIGGQGDDDDDSLALSDSALMRRDSLGLSHTDSLRVVLRDSIYRTTLAELRGDTLRATIEDYSVGHTGLRRFFAALNGIPTLGRPVRVAFLGDSFIEGDILTADFRNRMQERFGGRGVGFVPVASQVEQFRPTIRQRSKGWTTRSILSDRKHKYLLSCLLFDAAADAPTITFQTTDYFPRLSRVGTLKFIYTRNTSAEIRWICNEGRDTIAARLPETDGVAQYVARGTFTDGRLIFTRAASTRHRTRGRPRRGGRQLRPPWQLRPAPRGARRRRLPGAATPPAVRPHRLAIRPQRSSRAHEGLRLLSRPHGGDHPARTRRVPRGRHPPARRLRPQQGGGR